MACSVATLVTVLWVASAHASLRDSQGWSVSKHTYGPPGNVQAKLVCEYLWPGLYSRVEAPREGNGGYIIRSALVDQLNGKYTVGHQYTLDLIGLVNPYEGFIIQARDRWNEGLILGSFIPLDTSKAQTILCHGNEHGTVTHKTKDPVSVQSFIWQAPPTLEGSGEVDFVYSVMHSSLEYWVRINASSSPDLTYKGVQAHDVSPMDAPCPSGPPPNAVYRFTATNPPNCVQSTCDYFLGIRTNDNDPTYLDFVLEGSATGWVGVGFAENYAMGPADVLGCVLVVSTSEVAIVDAWNVPASDPANNNVRDDIQNVCPHSANYSNGRIQCVFSRQIITNDTAQDVPMNGTYYLLYGRGKSPTGSSPPVLTFHGAQPQLIPPISDNPIEPDTASNYVPTHPCPSTPPPNAVYRFTATNPPNCTANCDYFLGIRTNDNDPTYLDFVLEGSATGWVGVGFAPSPAMPSADVLGCVVQVSTSEVAIVDAWNVAPPEDRISVRDDMQNVCPHSASYSSGRIQCVFSRQIITNDTAQDVPMNGTYYLLYGRGESPTGSSPPALTYHGAQLIPPISDNSIEPDTASNIPTPTPIPTPTHPCPSTPPPNAVYRFTATNPPNCVQSTCDYFLGIRTNDNDPTYLDFVLEGSATGWVGVGFAPSPAMGPADVLGCVVLVSSSEVAIVDAWNVAGGFNNVRDTIQNVCPHSASYSSGRIQCVFSRQIITNDTAQDVPMNGTYYLLYGRGESPTGSSPPALTPHGTDFIPPISDNSIEPDTASNTPTPTSTPTSTPIPTPTHPCPSTPPPNAVYRFTATNPPNCVQSTCDYFLGIRTNDNDPTYLDFVLEGSATGWVGVGFASSSAMGPADVLGCVVQVGTSEVAIVDAWNVPPSPDNYNVRDDIQNVCPHSASYSNGRIQCVFSRQIITNDTAQDVPMNGTYYLLYGRGETPTGSSHPALTNHGANFNPPISDNMVDPATFAGNFSGSGDPLHSVMVRVHGVVMTVAFSIFGVIGIFFAAWMKPVLVQNGCWFQLHRGMMIASLFLGTFGFICIFVAHRHASFRGHYGLVPLDNPGDIVHFTCGVVVMVMLVANPIIAIFRCKPDAPRRWIYNLVHGAMVGLVFEVLVLANSCVGFYLLLGGVGSMFYIYLFFSIFTVVMNIVLVLVVAFISEGNGDLPAVVRLIHMLCLSLRLRRLYDKRAVNDDDVPLVLGDNTGTKDIKLLSVTMRWVTFCLYTTISVTALLVVVVMVTQTDPG